MSAVAGGDGVLDTLNEGHRRFDRGSVMSRRTLSISITYGGSETERPNEREECKTG